MPGEYRKDVMSDALKDAIKERRVKTAVFLTYQFDPVFFEQHILPVIFSRSFSHMPNVKLAQLEDDLRDMDNIAVYYDRHGLIGESGSAKLDYRRYEISRKSGVFHSKNIFLLVENIEKDIAVDDSLVVLTTSANITQNGWWENVEVVQIAEIEVNKISSFKNDLITYDRRKGLLEQVKDYVKYAESQPGIDSVRSFLSKSVNSTQKASYNGILYPRIFSGRESFSEFISSELGIERNTYNMEIISPYFEGNDNAEMLKEFIDTIDPISVRIYLPLNTDGSASCSEEYFNAVKSIKKVSWSSLPAAYIEWKRGGSDRRFVHAKVYRLFSKLHKKEYIISGSVNLTGSAHSFNRTGNFETAVFTDTSDNKNYDWILQSADADSITSFMNQIPDEDGNSLESFYSISLRFDWKSEMLSYFWEDTGDKPVSVVFHFNEKNLSLNNIKYGDWFSIDTSSITGFSNYIYASSIVRMADDKSLEQIILIQEEGMAYKPSQLRNLTPAEILEYWSLLSDEQRNRFLEERESLFIDRISGDNFINQPIPDYDISQNSMFDRFAGIFHAFSCLWEEIDKSLEDGKTKRAEYRLFGTKYDSVKSLVYKIKDESSNEESDKTDPVIHYIMLLCCRQIISSITGSYAEFSERFKQELRNLESDIKIISGIKDKIIFNDSGDDKDKFHAWFESIFLNRVTAEAE